LLPERGVGHVPEWDKKDIAEMDKYIDNLVKGEAELQRRRKVAS